MSKFSCIVNLDLVVRAMSCASTETTRYYLNGVHVEPHHESGAFLVATDGHKLICFHDAEAIVTGSGILSPSREILKAKAPKASRFGYSDIRELRLVANDARAMVLCDVDNARTLPTVDLDAPPPPECIAYQASGATIDGSFPEWRRVVPRDCSAPCGAAFSISHVLDPLARALSNDRKTNALRLFANAESGKGAMVNPALAFGSDPRGFGVAMPLRAFESMSGAAPVWLYEQAPSNVVQFEAAA